MRSNAIIKVEGLSKKYTLAKNSGIKADTLYGAAFNSLKNLRNLSRKKETEEFWALKDVSFEINEGDRVGIIGRNGAGKSTLLKILSRITPPTSGKIEYYGRMASLLEVGTGFHGDLSGRENIYLNGSILGMTRHEIDKKFDEIVEFSEIEQFLDTPVKRYSSGMYVRLAFAVAAHLEPEILIVDEVLAVGDAAFQKKCLGKMNDISNQQGRTILFVSHSMDAVQKLCNKGILLNKGRVIESAPIDKVIKTYLEDNTLSNGYFEITHNQVENTGNLGSISEVFILDGKNEVVSEVPTGAAWKIKIVFSIHAPNESCVIGYGLQGMFGDPINTSWSKSESLGVGTYEVIFENKEIYYNTGQYKLALGLSNYNKTYFYNDTEAFLMISDAGVTYETDRIVNKSSGLILNQLPVQINKLA